MLQGPLIVTMNNMRNKTSNLKITHQPWAEMEAAAEFEVSYWYSLYRFQMILLVPLVAYPPKIPFQRMKVGPLLAHINDEHSEIFRRYFNSFQYGDGDIEDNIGNLYTQYYSFVSMIWKFINTKLYLVQKVFLKVHQRRRTEVTFYFIRTQQDIIAIKRAGIIPNMTSKIVREFNVYFVFLLSAEPIGETEFLWWLF